MQQPPVDELDGAELELPYAEAVRGATMVGTLLKRQRRLGMFVERRFVLRHLDDKRLFGPALLYYRTKEDLFPQRAIRLHEGCKLFPKLFDEDKHCLVLRRPNVERDLVVYAATKKLSSQWIMALESAFRDSGGPPKPAAKERRESNRPQIKEPKTRHTRHIAKFYDVYEELGSGGFAVVNRGVQKETGLECALKSIPLTTYRKSRARTDSEIMVLSACHHDNVMRLYEVVYTETSLVMCTELLSGGELFDRIVARAKYTENDAKQVATAVLNAVNYLHSNGIVHRDLKPENLIFDRAGDDATLKITDFGFATIMEPNKKLRNACGTPEYVAPEVLADKPYDQAADMWSCGVIIYILLCGYPPFFAKTEKDLFQKILKRQFEFHHRFWAKISPEAKDLINKLIESNPLKRLTAKQALIHPWIRREVADGGNENMSDVMIQLKRFNAARKFRKGVLAVVATTRLFDL